VKPLFTGPKLDVQTKNVLGKEDTIATVQIDILVPQRMDLTYVDDKGEKQNPYVIHKSIMGAFERFMAILLERTAGNLPIWLSPEQVRLITVNQEPETVAFAEEVLAKAKELGVRATIDNASESVGKKIRESELMKIPYTLVIGEKEISIGNVMPRIRKDIEVDESQDPIPVDNFLKTIYNESKAKVSKTSVHGHKANRD
jgi:threonyl-tRNA synthetase